MVTIGNAPGGQDASVGGGEKIPVDDAGTGKYLTVEQVKDYTVDEIEAISAGSSVSGSDGIFVLQGGVMKPIDIDTVLQHIIDAVWGKSAETSPDDADVLLLKDGGATEKTVTLAYLAEYVRETIEAAILDVSDLADGSGALATSDYILVTQGSTAKQVTVDDLNTLIYSSLKTYVDGLTEVVTSVGADKFYCIQGGVEKEVSLTNIAAFVESKLPTTTTENNIPQWDNATGSLKNGKGVVTEVGASASDSDVPTEQAVREALSTVVYDQADIGAALADADTIVVDDGALGTTQRKSALSRVWTYILAKIEAATGITLGSPVIDTKLTFDETTNDLDITASDQSSASSSVDFPDIDGIDATAVVVPTAVDGTLATGANADFEPTKLVYNKTCSDSDGNDVIDLHDGTYLGQILTVYLGTKGGTDNAVITPVTAVSYTTITLDAANEIATLQWQGATVGWAILYTSGTVA